MTVKVSVPHRRLVLPYREDVANLLPAAKRFQYNTDSLLAVPHGKSEVRLLRSLGIHTPAPILYYYDWAGFETPYASQKQTAALLSMSHRAYVLSSLGTGKTLATLFAADYLIQTQEVNAVLIVAPLSTLNPVWYREVFTVFPHLKPVVLFGTRARRQKLALSNEFNVFIINHDALQIVQNELHKRGDIDLVIIDELTAYKNAQTNRWKHAKNFTKNVSFLWGLTGAPTPNDPTDAYAQAKLITPHRVPKAFRHFRAQTMIQVSTFRWVPKRDAISHVYDALQPSVRFTREDCYDLPPVTYTDRQVSFSPAQDKFYKTLVSKYVVEYKQHKITASNEGVKMGKLLQICSGFIYTDQHKTLSLSPTQRLDELVSIIDAADHKVIVFAPFIHAVSQLYLYLQKLYSTRMVWGQTPKNERDEIFRQFQYEDDPHVLVAHPKCMSHGLTLTAADTIVWYLPTTSTETYVQANGRITRAGQTNKQLIIHLYSSKIEQQIYKNLQQNIKTQGLLLDMFEGVDEGL